MVVPLSPTLFLFMIISMTVAKEIQRGKRRQGGSLPIYPSFSLRISEVKEWCRSGSFLLPPPFFFSLLLSFFFNVRAESAQPVLSFFPLFPLMTVTLRRTITLQLEEYLYCTFSPPLFPPICRNGGRGHCGIFPSSFFIFPQKTC